MIYTVEIRKKLDAILKAFEEYIDQQSYFDIVYSKKIGYVWILADAPDTLTLSEWEENETRRRITAVLMPLAEDKESYLQFLDRYLKAYQENNGHIGEPDEL